MKAGIFHSVEHTTQSKSSESSEVRPLHSVSDMLRESRAFVAAASAIGISSMFYSRKKQTQMQAVSALERTDWVADFPEEIQVRRSMPVPVTYILTTIY